MREAYWRRWLRHCYCRTREQVSWHSQHYCTLERLGKRFHYCTLERLAKRFHYQPGMQHRRYCYCDHEDLLGCREMETQDRVDRLRQ